MKIVMQNKRLFVAFLQLNNQKQHFFLFRGIWGIFNGPLGGNYQLGLATLGYMHQVEHVQAHPLAMPHAERN